MSELFSPNFNESHIRLELPRPYEGDSSVDIDHWQQKPSAELVEVVGDLSDSRNLTSFKAVQLAAITISTFGQPGNDRSSVDVRYVMNAFGFVVDNRRQLGWMSEEENQLLTNLSGAIGVAEYEAAIRDRVSR